MPENNAVVSSKDRVRVPKILSSTKVNSPDSKFKKKKKKKKKKERENSGVPVMAQWLMNPTRNH